MTRSRSLAAGALAWIAISVSLCGFTPTRVPGFLHALAVNLLVGTLGLFIAVTIGRLAAADARNESRPPRPSPDEGTSSPWKLCIPALTATVFLTALVVASFGIALANGLLVGLCEVWSVVPFYLFLPIGSAVLVAVTGTLVALVARRRIFAGAICAGLLLLSLCITVWPIMTGPQAFAFNHFLGHVPGPLYDESFAIDGAIVGWRLLTLAWTGFLLGFGILLSRPERLGLMARVHYRGRGALLLVALSLCLLGLLQWKRSDLGFHQTHSSVARALGGKIRTGGIVIYYPEERPEEWVRKVVRDHEYQYSVLFEWLALENEHLREVRSYVFRSPAEKRRLTGAGRTSIAKPWLWAMYIHDRPYPHPILRHELAHVLAASFGTPPFQASGRGLLGMNSGLIEGLAVAADWPADELSVHGWARAMKDVGAAPDIRGLFTAAGFLSQSSARAYTLAGSFVRWMADTHGIETVKKAYRAGDLSAIGDPEAFFTQWETFLKEQDLGEETRRLAEHRFRRPSILRRPCAFDVSSARARAGRALATSHYDEAAKYFARAATLEPNDPWHLKGLIDVHMASGDLEAASESAKRVLSHENTDARLRANTTMILGDIAWRSDDSDAATNYYETALEIAGGTALARLAAAKKMAAADIFLSKALRPFLLGDLRRDLALLHLREALETRPEESLLHYLIGRQVHNAGESAWAIDYLRRADELGMPDKGGLRIECLRLIARALYDDGEDPKAAALAWERVAKDPDTSEGGRLAALDWARRARFMGRMQASRESGGCPPARDGAPNTNPWDK